MESRLIALRAALIEGDADEVHGGRHTQEDAGHVGAMPIAILRVGQSKCFPFFDGPIFVRGEGNSGVKHGDPHVAAATRNLGEPFEMPLLAPHRL